MTTIFLPMRTQPPHKGHISLLETMCDQAEHVIVGIGSANIHNALNPYEADERRFMLNYSLKEKGLTNYSFVNLYDFEKNEDWIEHIEQKVSRDVTVATGNPWVQEIMGDIGYNILPLENIVLKEDVDISATRLREMIVADNPNWKTYAASGTVKYFEILGGAKRIKKFYELGEEVPKDSYCVPQKTYLNT